MAAGSLPPKLEQIFSSLANPPLVERLRAIALAAADATAKLGDLDLSSFEVMSDGTADLSLWNELAPVMGQTLMDVNAFCDAVRAQTADASSLDTGWEVLGEANAALQAITDEIPRLGMTMRSPEVVSDRWNLLTTLQAFRGKFRDQVGDVVFRMASGMGHVTRREVVPGFGAQLKVALGLRAITADLGRLLGARLKQVRQAEQEDLQWNVAQLRKELGAFSSTAASRSLRSQDKRPLVELRAQLDRISEDPSPNREELATLVEALIGWVRSLEQLNRRQILVEQDRRTWAAVGVRIEQAQIQLDQPETASATLSEAVGLAQSLYGRDDGLDKFLRAARKKPVAERSPQEVEQAIEALRDLIANLQVNVD